MKYSAFVLAIILGGVFSGSHFVSAAEASRPLDGEKGKATTNAAEPQAPSKAPTEEEKKAAPLDPRKFIQHQPPNPFATSAATKAI